MEQVEVWKDIKGYEGFYQVSSFGRIRSVDRVIKRKSNGEIHVKSKYLNFHILKNGYKKVDLYKFGNRKSVYVHRIVAEAFLNNPKEKSDVNHIDGDKTNNRIENLEWATRSENMKHAFNIGLCETTEKQRESMRKSGKTNIKSAISSRKKRVNQYEINGNYIRTWDSIASAEKELGISLKHMSKHCNGKQKTLCGYIWEYAD